MDSDAWAKVAALRRVAKPLELVLAVSQRVDGCFSLEPTQLYNALREAFGLLRTEMERAMGEHGQRMSVVAVPSRIALLGILGPGEFLAEIFHSDSLRAALRAALAENASTFPTDGDLLGLIGSSDTAGMIDSISNELHDARGGGLNVDVKFARSILRTCSRDLLSAKNTYKRLKKVEDGIESVRTDFQAHAIASAQSSAGLFQFSQTTKRELDTVKSDVEMLKQMLLKQRRVSFASTASTASDSDMP
jgi:hypothetical protein